MTDGTIPAAAYPPPPAPGVPGGAPARKPIWPWILGGSLLLLVLVVAGAVVTVTLFLTAGAGAKKTVLDYDLAYKDADCALLEASVTPEFESGYFGEPFDCGAWQDTARQLTVGGEYEYSVLIVSARETGDTAQVRAVETDTTDDEPMIYNVVYSLVREDGHWLIDNIDDGTS